MKEAVRVFERLMKMYKINPTSTRKKGTNTPFSNHEYRPELDPTEFCDDELGAVYQNLIRILCWTCELGRINVLHETSILSQYLTQPRLGHLIQYLNIFYYLKHHDRSWMLMNHASYDALWVPRRGESSPQERDMAMK